jgi:hypothetical protein
LMFDVTGQMIVDACGPFCDCTRVQCLIVSVKKCHHSVI